MIGQTLIAEITVPLHKLSGSGKTPSQWSELEGWSIDYFNTSVRPKLDTAYQIEYKYIPQQKAQATLESSVTDPVKIYVDGSDIKGTGAMVLVQFTSSMVKSMDCLVQNKEKT